MLKQLQLELSEKGNDRYVEYNFENLKSKDMVLYDLSRQMMKKCKGLEFPIFDYAFEKYHVLGGQSYLSKQLLNKENVLEHHLIGNSINIAGDFVPFVSTVSSVISEGAKAVAALAKKYEQVKGVNAGIMEEMDEQLILETRLSISIDLCEKEDYIHAYEMECENYRMAVDLFGKNSWDALQYYGFIADDLERLGRIEEAEEIREKIEQIWEGMDE